MKTNKSFTKRLKVTRNGKIIGRKPGQNHFNSRETRRAQLNKKRGVPFLMKNKARGRFLATSF